MTTRACIFVDGENFRHSITSLFPNFKQQEYLPRSANWTSLFDRIVAGVSRDAERIRTYWYVIEAVDFSPYWFPDINNERASLRKLLSRHLPFRDRLNSVEGDSLKSTMEDMVWNLQRNQRRILNRSNGWRTIQDGISQRHDAVEFRRAGAITYNLFEEQFKREKAVDVKLASDMIMLRDIYDIAIILSDDQDYVPAVQVVKDSGKRVVNVGFLTRGGQLLPGGARRLNQVTDRSINIKYADLAPLLGL